MATQAVSATTPTITKKDLDLPKAALKYSMLTMREYECLKASCEEEVNCWKNRGPLPGEIASKSQKYVQRSEVLSSAQKTIQDYLPILKEKISKQPKDLGPEKPQWDELEMLASDIGTISDRIIGRKSKFETALSKLQNYQEEAIAERLAKAATSIKNTVLNWAYYGPSTAASPEKPKPQYVDPLGDDYEFNQQFQSPFAKKSTNPDEQKSSEPEDLSEWTQASAWDAGAPKIYGASSGSVQVSNNMKNNSPSASFIKKDASDTGAKADKSAHPKISLSEPEEFLSKSFDELNFEEENHRSLTSTSRVQRAHSADAENPKHPSLSKASIGSKSADDVNSLRNEGVASASSESPSANDVSGKQNEKLLSQTSGAARRRRQREKTAATAS